MDFLDTLNIIESWNYSNNTNNLSINNYNDILCELTQPNGKNYYNNYILNIINDIKNNDMFISHVKMQYKYLFDINTNSIK